MSELTHTPGPWSVVAGYYPGMLDIVGPSFKITVVTTALDLEFKDFVARTNDCHLIAAAPDLLKTLERIARPHDCGCVPCTGSCTSQEALQVAVDEMRELAKDAIAKARGQS